MNQEFNPVPPEKHSTSEANTWAMVLHLSMLISYSVVGIVAPIAIWLIKKDQFPIIDQHGKNAVNWILSAIIYFIPSVLLVPFLIGIPMIVALGIAGVIFPIVAGIKASSGELWAYPLSIKFFD